MTHKLLVVMTTLAMIGLAFLYLQVVYAASLHCPDKIDMGIIPRCVR